MTLQEKIDKVKTFKEPVLYHSKHDVINFNFLDGNIKIIPSDWIEKGTFVILDKADNLFKLDTLEKWYYNA